MNADVATGEKTINNELGTIKIADEVVAIIAGLAATEINGMAGMSGGIVGGIAEMLGRKNLTKGIKVEVGDKQAAIDIFIVVEFGVSIPQVALKIQEKVRHDVESMTGLNVIEINVHVQGVVFPNQNQDTAEVPKTKED